MQILVADDHNLVREGLRPFLLELDPDAEILNAATLDEAVAEADKAETLGLVLLDLKMPGMDGLNGLSRLKQRHPQVPVVILTGHITRQDVLAAMRAGASGYVPKTITGASLVNALRLVLSGERYLPSSVFSGEHAENEAAEQPKASPLATLSPREREILSLLIEGRTNKDIARRLELQEITIKIHLRNVYRKIGAANRAQAVRIAMTAGWTYIPAD